MKTISKKNPMLDSFIIFGHWPKNLLEKTWELSFHMKRPQQEHQDNCNSFEASPVERGCQRQPGHPQVCGDP